MDRRQSLSTLLHGLGFTNVYFQPDENTQMQYPCIVYGRDGDYRVSADNAGYYREQRYQVTIIDRDPENPAIETLAMMPKCRHNRSFTASGLNHDVFELYH